MRLQRTELRTALHTFSVMCVEAHSFGQRQTRSVHKVEVPWRAFYSLGYLHNTESHHSANLHGKECLINLVTSALACLKIVLIGMTKLYCSKTPTIPQECRGFIHVKSFVRSAVRSHGEGGHGARAHRDSDDEHRIFSSARVTDTKGKSAALFRCGECPAKFFE